MSQRWFTPRSARQTLARLRANAELMCRLYRTMERTRPRPVVPEQPVDRAYFLLLSRLHAELEQIHASGAQVKDVRQGLVDFPARRDGREVLLCWKVGEATLEYWHETQAGYASRRPVDEDGPWEEA